MTQAGASHAGTFRIPVASREAAQRLVRVLEVEAAATPEGTRVTMSSEEAVVVVAVEADDARSLRAATNSILRLVAVAADVDGR
jgi:tRNA threonylcarbamoyladenosine modification (KEOPS) complex  Pcc1 subunit